MARFEKLEVEKFVVVEEIASLSCTMAKIKLRPFSRTSKEAAARLAIAVFVASALGYAVLLPNLPKRGKEGSYFLRAPPLFFDLFFDLLSLNSPNSLSTTNQRTTGIAVEFADEVAAACKWAAITCIVINSPLLAKCAQTGAERVAGTVAGGAAGFAAYSLGAALGARAGSQVADGLLLAAAAALVAWIGSAVGVIYGLQYSSKLFSQTFVLVAFGAAADEKPPGGAAALAASRVLGIGGGVVLMEACSILLWPRTATQGCLLSLAEAAASVADAADAAWGGSLLAWTGESIHNEENVKEEEEEESASASPAPARRLRSSKKSRGNDEGDIEAPLLSGGELEEEGEAPPPAAAAAASASTSSAAAAAADAADALDAAAASLQSSLTTAADLAEQADAEIYIRKRGGGRRGGGRSQPLPTTTTAVHASPPPRHLFLPGPGPWTPAAWRALPKPEVERACSALRKVGRALGALHACRPRGGDEAKAWGGGSGGNVSGGSGEGGDGGEESNSSDGGSSGGRGGGGASPDDPSTAFSSPARALAAAYPPGLLRGAAEDCVSALRLAAANVPGPPPAEARAAAVAFGARAAALLRISDYNRRALARAAARGARGSGTARGFDASRAASEPVSFSDAAAAAVAAAEGGKGNASSFGSPSEAFESLPDSLAVDLTGEGSGVGAGSGSRRGRGDAAARAAEAEAPPPPAPPSASLPSATSRVRVQLRRLTSSQVAAACQFPPTAAGFEAQVRWHSLQLALQELSVGVEEAMRSLEALAGALPGPLAVAVPRTAK